MHKLIFSVAALLCFLSTSANSFTLKDVVDHCHAYAEANFEINNISREHLLKTGACLGYFGAFKEAGDINCLINMVEPDWEGAAFGFHENYAVEQLIQFTINFAKKYPEKWDEKVSLIPNQILPDPKCEHHR